MSRKSNDTVRLRIRRMGAQFATCGIGVRPPEHLVKDPTMKRLCPKLVPGQVIDLPRSHPLAHKSKSKMIEHVEDLEDDEILRPWVFKSPEAAIAANPAKSRISIEEIRNGLAMTEGAHATSREKTRQRHEEDLHDDDRDEPEESDYEDELESDDEVAERASNRVSRDIKDDARPVTDDEDDQEEPEEEEEPRRGKRAPRAAYRNRTGGRQRK